MNVSHSSDESSCQITFQIGLYGDGMNPANHAKLGNILQECTDILEKGRGRGGELEEGLYFMVVVLGCSMIDPKLRFRARSVRKHRVPRNKYSHMHTDPLMSVKAVLITFHPALLTTVRVK